MSGELVIRRARDDELDDVASLIVEAYAEYAARMPPDAWASFADDIANVRGRLSHTELLVAERDGQLCGSVTLFSDWQGVQLGTAGIRLLAVLPSARDAGVGRALMEDCLRRARDYGKDRVVLTVAQEMGAARELCEKLGFTRASELDHEPAPGVRVEGYALDLGAAR